MLLAYDDVFSAEKNKELYEFFLHDSAYNYGETDRKGLPPVGMVVEIQDPELIDFLSGVAKSKCEQLNANN